MTIKGRFIPSKHVHQIQNALCMQQWRGTFAAAKYLRATGWSIEAAQFILLNK